MLKKIFTILVILLMTFISTSIVKAEDLQNSTNNNYQIIIEDEANLLTEIEEIELKNYLSELTEYGNVLFKTTNTNTGYGSVKYIQNYYYSTFKNNKGVAFYIDMNKRQLCACASGGLEKIITNSKCDTIMDNVYRQASKGNYFGCAKETFTQMSELLSGNKIAEPMKYICNTILSIMISLFVTYGFYLLCSRNEKASKKEILVECGESLEYTPITAVKTGTHSVYSPVSDGGSYGGSSGGGSFGGRWWPEEDFQEVEEATAFKGIRKESF